MVKSMFTRMLLLALLCLPGLAHAGYVMAPSALPADGTVVTGYSVYIQDRVTPKIVQVDVLDPPRIVPAVYTYPEGADPTGGDDGVGGVLVTPEHQAEPSWHKEDQLNPHVPPVYPSAFGLRVWQPRQPDYYGDNLNQRAELWHDSTGAATWQDIRQVFPELPGLMETAARQWGADQTNEITFPYSEAEQKTWVYQRNDAVAWRLDPAAPTPYVDGLARTRGIPRETLLQKILENVDLFEYYSKWVFGSQQKLIDLIHGAATLAEIIDYADAMGLPLLERARRLGGVTP